LNFLARRVLDLDSCPALHPGARLTVRAQLETAKPSREALIRELETEGHCFVEEGGGPHVRVLAQALAQIGHERLELVGLSVPALAGPGAVQVIADRRPVPAEMSGDGRDRPALRAR